MGIKKSAVIIGAGIGGITTAVYLAKNGYNVKVFEKNQDPGGRCGRVIREGHRFDLGATMLVMPGIYRQVFDSLGLKLEDSLDVTTLDTLYKIYFDDGREIAFTTDKKRMEAQLESIEAGSFGKSQSYISKGYELFQVALNKLIGRNFYKLFDFINLKNALLLIRLKTYISHSVYIRKFFKHPHLRMAYTFQNIYVGQSPFNSPALFSMVPAVELIEGSMFPKGGMYSVVEKLLSMATDLGVQIMYNKPVAKIEVCRKKARGIVLSDGSEIEADIIVANADLPYVYRELLPDRKISSRIDHMKYSCSAIVFHWGLDKVYSQLGHHSVFLSDGYRNGLDRIFKEKSMDDSPSFYVHAPVRTDPSAAPPDQDTLSVIIGVGHIDEKYKQDWNKLKKNARVAVIKRLKYLGLEDIEDHIKFEMCYTPVAWENGFNISRGSVFGSLSHSIFQMGYFRPHNRHDRYKNLYFVGGSTHPGNGIPNILLSAKLTTERIIRETQI
jgi:phytoene desaturase